MDSKPFLLVNNFRKIYDGVRDNDLPDEIQDYGGLMDYIVDDFGFKVPICSLREGLDHIKRFKLVGE